MTDSLSPNPDQPGNLDETNDLDDASAPKIVSLLDDYLDQLKRGEAPDREEFLANHPEYADQLRACLASLDFLSKERDDLLGKKQIGDFRILAEIGQGGMGTVYEAEQVSLGRKVALKIVRAGRQSQEAIDRFQREAETVAALHHTNIVPIFSVGADEEINYFAMQLIDGKSLSQVSREADEPIEPKQATEWGLGVVEALAHAHERDVVHRDVKPSNILLDEEGNVWLSDFGLAKRSDDLTLSVTGAILGTPRYMSPEQARGAVEEVDHRSDIYSVGATLYELVTKSPVFDAASPHKIITRIIQDEPTSPRSLDKSIPKDLETILLKCLQKHPSDRYASANDLADDLRAFLDDRPISARPESIVERGSRWLRKKRSALSNVMLASIATILIAALGFGFESWRQLRGTADYLLSADVPGAVAEILDKDGKPVLDPVSLPTPKPITLRSGEYDIRVSAPGRFSVTRPVAVEQLTAIANQGRHPTFNFHLNSRLVGPPISIDDGYGVLPGQSRILSIGELGITCFDFRSGNPVWTSPVASWKEVKQEVPGFRWNWRTEKFIQELDEPNLRAPMVVTGIGDLDGDGRDDFLLAAKEDDWLIAFSSETGLPIWASAVGTHKDQQLTGPPLVMRDIDGDEVPDIVAVTEEPFMTQAISGKTGKAIWSGEDFAKDYWAYHSAPADGSPPARAVVLKEKKKSRNRTVRPHPAQTVTIEGKAYVLVVVGKYLRTYEPESGQVVHEQELPFRSSHAPIVKDIDGDGSSDVAVTELERNDQRLQLISTWSIKNGKSIFAESPHAYATPTSTTQNLRGREPQLPEFADFDQDGLLEVVHADGSTPSSLEVSHQDGYAMWTADIRTEWNSLNHFLVGPDINADGVQDVFVASLWKYAQHANYRSKLFLDALSGSDGEKIWTSFVDIQAPTEPVAGFVIRELMMWDQGASTFPTLVVTVHPQRDLVALPSATKTGPPNVQPKTFCFSTADGELLHRADQVANVEVTDVDGDGIDDLLAYHAERFRHEEVHNVQVSVLTGRGQKLWDRSRGYPLPMPTHDLNGDGRADMVQTRRTSRANTSVAISGLDGSTLWTTDRLHFEKRNCEVYSPPGNADFDVDDDGVQDLLSIGYPQPAYGNQPLAYALSGATGRRLWESPNVTDANKLSLIELKDLDQDGVQEIILVGSLEVGPDQKSAPRRLSHSYQMPYPKPELTMLVIDQLTGSLKWKRQLGEKNQPYLPEHSWDVSARGPNEAFEFDIDYVDLNGDGTLDVLAPIEPRTQVFELHAIDGVSGELMGLKIPLYNVESLLDLPRITVCDLDGDDRKEILVVSDDPAKAEVRVTAFDGKGAKLWERVFQLEHWVRDMIRSGSSDADRAGFRLAKAKRLRTKGNPCFAINLTGGKGFSRNTIVVLDAKGKTLGTPIQLESEVGRVRRFECWPVDVDDDGIDELAAVDGGTLIVRSVNEGFPVVWQRDLLGDESVHRHSSIAMDLLSADRDEFVMRKRTKDHRVVGIEKRTGEVRWTCPLDFEREAVLLRSEQNGGVVQPPSVLLQTKGYGLSLYQPVSGDASPQGSPITKRKSPTRDIRNRRYLPWAELQLQGQDFIRYLPTAIAWGLFNVSALLIFPALLLYRTISKGQWSMRTFLLLPVVSSIFLLDVIIGRDLALGQKFTLAFFFMPFLIFFTRQAFLLWKRRWFWVAFWLAIAALSSTPMVWYLWMMGQWEFSPGDYLVFDYWYVGILIGSWLAGVFIAIQLGFAWLRTIWTTRMSRGVTNAF